IVSESRLLHTGLRKIDAGVAPAGEVAQVSAHRRGRAAVVQVIAGAHQAVRTDARAADAVSVAIAVVVHIGKPAKQVTILMAEGADREIVRTTAESGEQVEVGLDAAKLHFEKRIVRP